MNLPIPRRDFLKGSAGFAAGALFGASVLSAASRNRVVGANGRLRIGQIGCGERGRNAHMKGIHRHLGVVDFEIVALCDPWRVAREQANALVTEWFGRPAKEFTSYRDLLALRDLDAVMIASPDHHHTTHLEAGAKAGRHVYVEKPLGDDLGKVISAVDAVKKSGVICQVGTQLRSLPSVTGAREVFQQGLIGKLNRVDEHRNSNKPYWYDYVDRDVRKEDVDWKEFLGDRPKRPFDRRLYAAWYGYMEFCLGPIPQWGAHFLDMMHYVTGCALPVSGTCLGTTSTWIDENRFDTPDNVTASWLYPEGFLVTSSNNLGNGHGSSRKFYGDKGVLKMDNWNSPTYSAEGGPRRDGSVRGENNVTPIDRPDHFLNWLQCVRDGQQPHAPIEAGYQHAVACLLATESYRTARRMKYDPARRTIRPA